MSADAAVRIVSALEKLGVTVILDGGWGIDALLGEQTRKHKDLDFLIEKKDLAKLKGYFAENNFKQTDNFNKWWHMSYENDQHIIDVHVIEIEKDGSAIYGPRGRDGFPEPGKFPAYSLHGKGIIAGLNVRCLSAEYRVKSQTRALLDLMPDNYQHQPDKHDYEDLLKICYKFNISMPEEIARLGGQPQDVQ